jgi:hypothetical protein
MPRLAPKAWGVVGEIEHYEATQRRSDEERRRLRREVADKKREKTRFSRWNPVRDNADGKRQVAHVRLENEVIMLAKAAIQKFPAPRDRGRSATEIKKSLESMYDPGKAVAIDKSEYQAPHLPECILDVAVNDIRINIWKIETRSTFSDRRST